MRLRGRACGLLCLTVACGGGHDRATRAGRKDSTRPLESRATPAPSRATAHVVVFMGTSLTAGLGLDPDSAFPQRIKRMIDSAGLRFGVINAGVSGETSAGALRRIDWLLQQPFDVLVLETGANDGLRGTDVAATRQNIQGIVDRVRAVRPDARIALVQMEALPNMGGEYRAAFHATFPMLARSNGVTLLPFLLEGVAGDPRLNQGDGVHPNNEGERIVARNVWRGLLPLLRARPSAP